MRRAWRGERGARRGFNQPRGKFGTIEDPRVIKGKKLSWALRHGFAEIGLSLNPAGYVKISDLVANPGFSEYTLDEILEIVARDEKQRYGISLEKKEY